MSGDLNDAIAKNNADKGACNIHKFPPIGDFNAVDAMLLKKTSIVNNLLPGHFSLTKRFYIEGLSTHYSLFC
jgi:hypothetical protein